MVKQDKVIDVYFENTKDFIDKYGPNTIVLMQVGSFFEMYGLRDENKKVYGSIVDKICDLCDLSYSVKNVNCNNNSNDIIMAGFPEYSLEKYIDKLVDNDYIVPVIVQHKQGKTVTRSLDAVYSKGTHLSSNNDGQHYQTNVIGCIWVNKYKLRKNDLNQKIAMGMAFINVMDGGCYLSEYCEQLLYAPTTLNELENQFTLYKPKELIFVSNMESHDFNKLFQYIDTTHIVCKYNKDDDSKEVENCKKKQYIQTILEKYYGDDIMKHSSEYNDNLSTQSLCYLLNYLEEHNRNITSHLKKPIISRKQERLILGNQTLKQLNVVEDHNGSGKLKSVLSFLNNSITSVGSRRFQYRLLNPSTNSCWLENEYSMNEYFKNTYEYTDVRAMLKGFKDVELILQKIFNHKITPMMIYQLYNSLNIGLELIESFGSDERMSKYLFDSDNIDETITYLNKAISKLDTIFDISKCETNNFNSIDDNILNANVDSLFDTIYKKYTDNVDFFYNVQSMLNNVLAKHENVSNYFTIHKKEKTWNSIVITKARTKIAEKALLKEKKQTLLDLSLIKFEKSTTTSNEVKHPKIKTCVDSILELREQGFELIKKLMDSHLTDFAHTYCDLIRSISNCVSKLDVLQCRIYNCVEYNYSLPQLSSDDNEKSFVNITDMRHCLIEQINTQEIYVPNDITLGNGETDGILLFGTNAVGKTSIIRSIGLCVIIAQSGMYVPCKKMVYQPYTAIYSRIIGNDNLFKGLSTFGSEMSELRTILNNVDENTLILGDELCSGTEQESAISIFLASIEKIHDSGASHIFATHLHEIVGCEELDCLTRTHCKHMTVSYDNEIDDIVYDRKIKDGSGPSCYGLEVCKSLHLEDNFIERAFQIRKKHFPTTQGLLSSTTSSYNSKKVKGKCEKCGDIGVDIHHLSEQHLADDNGFIDHFPKNHPANLMTLCKKCHNDLHSENIDLKQKKVKTLSGKYRVK